MPKRYILGLALALGMVLAGCSVPAVNSAAAPSVAAPAAGTASITGRVVANTNRAPIDKVLVRLAPLFTNKDTGEKAFALDLAQAPATTSDEQGYFTITDVTPNEYVIVIGDHYGVYDIIADPDGKARAHALAADQVLNAGILPVKPDVTKTP